MVNINMDVVRAVCKDRNLKEASISSFPTFVDMNHRMPNGNVEGLEVKGGKIVPFWSINGQKDYTEPTGDYMIATIHLIGELMSNPPVEQKPLEPKIISEPKIVSKDALGVELPEFLTPTLMAKWENLSTMERVLFFQKTPADKIDHVVVGKKDGKNITAPYVKGNYMVKEANAAFLFDWYLSDVQITVGTKGVSVVSTLNAWCKESGKYLQRPAIGYQELNGQVDCELAKKGATMDAIKKGLSFFGFNSDVYSGERE